LKKRRRSIDRKLRRLTSENLKRLLGEPKAPTESEPPENPAPRSGDASFEKPASKKELRYNTKTAPDGTSFTDARDRSYRTESGGQLRVLNKPKSRVKRLREERNRKVQKPTAG
jgi:hypothetical protein